MRVIIAEKPSVASDIANVLGIAQRYDGYFYDQQKSTAITWAFGHLFQIASPAEMGYSSWSRENLPMCPDNFTITPRTNSKPGGKKEEDPGIKKQIGIIADLFANATEIVCATDAGREGELIFRYIYYSLKCKVPVKRLWISSLTDESIRKGFQDLKDSSEYDNLYLAAKCRAEADWLVGLNATQALSVATEKRGGVLSLGRVQTPTLAMICKRYEEHMNFKSKYYHKLVVSLINSDGAFIAESGPIEDKAEALKLENAIKAKGSALTSELSAQNESIASPLLYDLTYLQQEANIKFAFSADQTLKAAQKLYESKLITYPRTSSRYISQDIFATVPGLLDFSSNLPESKNYTFPQEILTNAQNKILNKRPVNNEKISDHHAILPTGQFPKNITDTEQKIYDLIVSKMLEAFLPSSKVKRHKGIFTIDSIELFSSYTEVLSIGWRQVRNDAEEKEDSRNAALMHCVKDGLNRVGPIENLLLKTQPKKLLTEATLLKAMENCSDSIDDEILSEAIKGTGLGTPATRASIIELLFARDYISRKGKSIIPTQRGLHVFNTVKSMKISEALLTGEWEHKLGEIELQHLSDSDFIIGIKAYTCEIVTEILDTDFSQMEFSSEDEIICPKCKTKHMLFFDKAVKCADNTCGYYIYREIFKNKLSKATVADLLTKGKTKKLSGFFSEKKNKKFDGVLILDDELKVKLDF